VEVRYETKEKKEKKSVPAAGDTVDADTDIEQDDDRG
jgi:hypothetical protein